MNSNYIPIEICSLVEETTTGFDLYIERKSGTMVLYRGGDTPIDREILERLIDNRITKLYVNENDWEKYQEYITSHLSQIVADESIPVEKRSQIVYTASTRIMQQVFTEERTSEAVKKAQTIIGPTVSMILSGDDAIRAMISLTCHDYYTYTHSVNVCVYSTALTTKLFPNMPIEDFERLGSGYLLHDIGKREIPSEIINKKGPLSAEEWGVMKQHPEIGHRLLNEAGAATEEASVIALQHHERYHGGGYPNRLQGDDIHIWAKICCIADCFDALTTTRSYRVPSSSFSALHIMKHQMSKNFDDDFFHAFVELFKE